MRSFQPDAFQPDAFQVEPLAGVITQTGPAFTQTLAGNIGDIVIPDLPSEVLGRAFIFKAPRIAFGVNARITQTAPAFTQSLDVRVTDDELVLVLL